MGHSIAAAPALATAFELQVVQLQADQVTYTARGFRNKQNFINAIYFHCGGGISILGPLNSRKRQKKRLIVSQSKCTSTTSESLNNRYGEFERRLFEFLAKSGDRVFVVGAGGDLLVANAVKDGFFEDNHVEGAGLEVTGSNGFRRNFPMSFTYWVTETGVDFIKRYAAGADIA